jgi:hypothetical protein
VIHVCVVIGRRSKHCDIHQYHVGRAKKALGVFVYAPAPRPSQPPYLATRSFIVHFYMLVLGSTSAGHIVYSRSCDSTVSYEIHLIL